MSLQETLQEAGEWAEGHTRDSWHVQCLVCSVGIAITVVMQPPEGSDIEPLSMSHGVTWLEIETYQPGNLLVEHMQGMYRQVKAELYRRMYSGKP